MLNKTLVLFAFILHSILSFSQNRTPDSIQIAGLCKVWGLIKFYHPDVTNNTVDWDKILIKKYPEFAQKNNFESYNQKIISLIDTLGKKSFHQKINKKQYDAIINDRIEELDNFKFLADTNNYINRISFSWINDTIFSKETKNRLCEILINYKPYESKQLKGKLVVKHIENKFEELDSIPEPYRILALFRYWNSINYFFPHKNISDNNWDSVLVEMIPKFATSTNYIAYINQLRKISSKTNDSHGYYQFFSNKYYTAKNDSTKNKVIGYMPYNFRLIDENMVVSKLLLDSTKLNLGDIIVSINGISLREAQKNYVKSTSNSTKQAEIESWETRITNLPASKFDFKVYKKGDTISVTENNSVDRTIKKESNYRKPPYYYSINDKTGYVELTLIKFGKLKKALKEFKNKETIIFDMRGYPESIAWLALPHLLKNKSKEVALFSYPNKKFPGTYINNTKGVTYRFWFVKPFVLFRKQFKGKVVVLINAEAVSQSETVCMMFKAYADDVTFVGTPTKGANGDVSSIFLPGGISFYFTSLDWYYPDGSQLQRIGIIPDIYVKETVEGIKLGKDEILEKAIQFLEK